MKFDDSDINELTIVSVRMEVREYIVSIVERHNIDFIFGIPRKGYWIVDDAVKTYLRGYDVECVNFDSNYPYEVAGKNVLIFDDTINTGLHVREAVLKIRESGPASIVVGTLAIIEQTARSLEADLVSDIPFHVESSRAFKSYESYENGRVVPGCLCYYYAFVVRPLIYSLCLNPVNDYCNWFFRTDTVCSNVILDRIKQTLGITVHHVVLEEEYRSRYILPIPWDMAYPGYRPESKSLSKLRISTVSLDDEVLVMVTPVMNPVVDHNQSNDDAQSFFNNISRNFIESIKKRVLDMMIDIHARQVGSLLIFNECK